MKVVKAPQINANEDELEITDVYVQEGQRVEKGEILCTLESTKATVDLEAPGQGFVRALGIASGERVRTGQTICVLTETATESIEHVARKSPSLSGEPRATRRAASLVEEYDLDITGIEHQGILTERDVLQFLGRKKEDLRAPGDQAQSAAAELFGGRGDGIVIYGAGGHARVVIDTIREGRRDLEVVGIIDDGADRPDEVMGIPVLGDVSILPELRERGVRLAALGVGAVTHNALRAELFERLKRQGFSLPNLIHPAATVEPSARMGEGNQIFAGAVVSSNVRLGNNTIINCNAVVSHDCRIGDHVHLTPGALLAGSVGVGERTVIGMGVTIYLGVSVGADVMVANGNHILQDIGDRQVLRAR